MTDPTQPTILALFAHPDDESFGSGGTLARYAKQGATVTLVCATNGDVGEISDPSLATPETLPQVRQAELICACEALGIEPPIFLEYRDSGMIDTPENENPKAFMNVPAAEVVSRLVALIRQLRPQVVITFDPDGGYGHPDHIAIHRHGVTAFHAAANPAQFPEQGPAWQAERLLYAVIPRSFFDRMREKMKEAGLETEQIDWFEEEGKEMGWPDDQIHITVDAEQTVDAKWRALECHRTQFGPDNPFRQFPEAETRQMMSQEYFFVAWPEPDTAVQLTDIFESI